MRGAKRLLARRGGEGERGTPRTWSLGDVMTVFAVRRRAFRPVTGLISSRWRRGSLPEERAGADQEPLSRRCALWVVRGGRGGRVVLIPC